MTTNFREMQLNRGFGEVEYLLRISNVRKDCVGYAPLLAAIMAYLQDSSLSFKQLMQIGYENSSARIGNPEECFEAMKDALQDIYTGHPEKVLDDNVVYIFIQNISAEVRMRELLKMRILNEDLKAGESVISVIVRLAIRKLMKPEDNFAEIINHTAGKVGFSDAKDLLYEEYPIVANKDIKSYIEDATKNITNPKEKAIAQKELLKPCARDIESIINDLIDNYLNLHF